MTGLKDKGEKNSFLSPRWQIIPESWKEDLDTKLSIIRSLNRDYIFHCQESARSVSQTNPSDFIRRLRGAWINHNAFFSLQIELLLALREDLALNKEDAEEITQILRDSELVDTITLFYGLGTKIHLDEETRKRGENIAPFRTFYLEYPIDHIREDLSFVLEKYHAGSLALFQQRKKKQPLKRIYNTSQKEKVLKDLLQKKEKLFTSTLYNLWLERDIETRSLVEISTSDNYDEYVWGYNLEGIEGFFLKTWILENESDDIKALTNYKADLYVEKIQRRIHRISSALPRITESQNYKQAISWFHQEKIQLEERGIRVIL